MLAAILSSNRNAAFVRRALLGLKFILPIAASLHWLFRVSTAGVLCEKVPVDESSSIHAGKRSLAKGRLINCIVIMCYGLKIKLIGIKYKCIGFTKVILFFVTGVGAKYVAALRLITDF